MDFDWPAVVEDNQNNTSRVGEGRVLMNKLMYRFVTTRKKKNKMPATLALRVMLGLIHLFQLYASPIDKSILANGIA